MGSSSFAARCWLVRVAPWLLTLLLIACGQVGVNGANSPSSTGQGVTPPPAGPLTISGTPASSVIVGEVYSFTPTASDTTGSTLTYSIVNLPDWASFDSANGQLSGTPSAANVGAYSNITISVSDGSSSATLAPFTITVAVQLTIGGSPVTATTVGASYLFKPTTNAAPGAALTFSISNAPPWAQFDTATGALSGTPTQPGVYANIILAVSDGLQSSSLPAFTITVTNGTATDPPSISGQPATAVAAGSSYSFTPTASDPAKRALSFSIQNQPAWATFNVATGSLNGTPSASQAGTYAGILISVSDGVRSAALPAFSIKVVAALSISGSPATQAVIGKPYAFQPTTNAASGTSLVFSIKGRPGWASFSGATGLLSGTPAPGQSGTYTNIIISVSDGIQSVSLAPFSIQITSPLSISGSPPPQVVAGQKYAFQPSTNAQTGTALTFSIQNKPAWASFNVSTGALTGSPSNSQLGTYSGILISVTDGSQSNSLPPFSITVTAASTLTISGTPPTAVNVGSAYAFTPTTTNPSGTTLTFNIQNKPIWATFDTNNGTLSGSPATDNVGSYGNIVISVSDGSTNASLAPFSINVTQVSTGSATLNWTAVTQNTNGTVLTDLAGYKVHYGNTSGALTTVVVLANPSLTTYLIPNLSPGVWYFGVTAYASDGTESTLSNIGSKTIN